MTVSTSGIGRHLRNLREQRGLSVAEVARRMSVHESSVRHLERNTHEPTVARVKRYCDAIGARIHIGLAETAHTDQSSEEKP